MGYILRQGLSGLDYLPSVILRRPGQRPPGGVTQQRPGQPVPGGYRTPTAPVVRPGYQGSHSTPTLAQIASRAYQPARKLVMAPTMQVPTYGAGAGAGAGPVQQPGGMVVTTGLDLSFCLANPNDPKCIVPAAPPAAPPVATPPAPKPAPQLFVGGGGGGGVMATGGRGVPLPDVNFDVPDDSPTSTEFMTPAKKPFPAKVVIGVAVVAAVGIYFYTRKKGK